MKKVNKIQGHYLIAADIIIKTMKTPGTFLRFLTEALHWIHYYYLKTGEKDPNNTPHYEITQMIEEIVKPWYDNKKETRIAIAEGIEKQKDLIGSDEFFKNIMQIVSAFGQYQTEVILFKEHIDKYFSYISMLTDVHTCMAAAEDEKNFLMQKKKTA